MAKNFRNAIVDYIRENARPEDKFSHQPRLYALAVEIAGASAFDDDVLFAAAWMHDIGVFIGHRPEDPAELARWDNVAYAVAKVPGLLREFRFPEAKINEVAESIKTHLPSSEPASYEGELLRDADILEQLGAVAVLRTISKIGRDTRFRTFGDAICVLERNAGELPAKLRLARAREMAEPKIAAMRTLFNAAKAESRGVEW
jgi:uncharacterized protein